MATNCQATNQLLLNHILRKISHNNEVSNILGILTRTWTGPLRHSLYLLFVKYYTAHEHIIEWINGQILIEILVHKYVRQDQTKDSKQQIDHNRN